ncbi:MAG TPA: Hsp20/alpha crystallin family protein [Vicinamibacterales bacterium]|nr:Hsp20/alpha crystallin family protein [Vicinamibacterales bacterium]
MRSRLHAVSLPAETADFADDLRRIFDELDRTVPGPPAGECAPAIDVHETDATLEVVIDLPDVDAAAIRVLIKGQTLLVAGRKTPRRGRPDSSFHLVERGYGRFARTIRLVVPCDTAKAQAELARGELRIHLPKLAERRGQPISVPIRTAGD